MKTISYSAYVDGASGFSLRYVEIDGQKWYVARDMLNSMGVRPCTTETMPRIAASLWRRGDFMGRHNIYLLSIEGCRQLLKLYRCNNSKKLAEFLERHTLALPGPPAIIARPREKPSDLQSLAAIVKANQEAIEQIQVSLNQLVKIAAENRQGKITKEPETTANESSVAIVPADRLNWRHWCNLMVTRLVYAVGDRNKRAVASAIWKNLLTPIEKEFNVNFWELIAEQTKELRNKKRKGYVSRLSIVDKNDQWMRMLVDNIVTMAKSSGIPLEVQGIPMAKVTVSKQETTA